MNENMLLGLIIIVFIIFIGINRGMSGKPMELVTTEAGLGSLLAGAFFGVVREVLLKRPANFKITLIAILGFFLWYVLTKGLSTLFINSTTMNISTKETAGNESKLEAENEQKSKEIKKEAKQKLPDIYNVFIAALIILLVVILMISFYAQRKEGADKHISNFNIMVTCMVVLAGFFTFLSKKKLSNEMKIKILSYTIAFAIVFCIFAPVFVFKSFSFVSLIISTMIFFVWLTLTFSFSNFATPTVSYIKRY